MASLPTLLQLLLCFLPFLATAQKVLPIGFSRQRHSAHSAHSAVQRRTTTYSQIINNNLTGGGYYAEVSVGTPPQTVNLILDTGSSDLWVLDSHADLCSSQKLQAYYGNCLATFDPDDSSTYVNLPRADFSIQYVDGSGAQGNYFKDTLHVGTANITSLQMGLAENTTINSGLMGVGFATNEAAKTPYPNIIDLFASQDLIAKQVYSLYLDDLNAETGTILFGGMDTEKFIGELSIIDIQPDSQTGNYTSFTVTLDSLAITASNGTATNFTQVPLPVVLDSGTTLSYLPSSVAENIFDAFGAVDDTLSGGTGLVYVDCDYLSNSQDLTFDFRFDAEDGPLIRVPIDEIVLDNVEDYEQLGLRVPQLPFDHVCSFGIQSSSGVYLLGDTFLRSAYVVYDLTDKNIGLAQANLNSTKTNILEISSAIPSVTGVASQVSASQTATITPGNGDGGLPTVTTTASPSSGAGDTTDSAAPRGVPAPKWEPAFVMAVSGMFAFMGAGLLAL
ncbi:aspartic peptidase domain-containing protein [Xylariomycetidae sp. FL0641]|nr:aspartic peptidase domain-containing protein [Xylariomycetidae sp. FL0641]